MLGTQLLIQQADIDGPVAVVVGRRLRERIDDASEALSLGRFVTPAVDAPLAAAMVTDGIGMSNKD
jgi:hypothetical protein